MKRMNLREIPDDVYDAIAEAAAENRQSLNAYMLDRLMEAAQVAKLRDGYFSSYVPPSTGLTLDDVVEAVHEGRREAS